jgi:hypothetical protein
MTTKTKQEEVLAFIASKKQQLVDLEAMLKAQRESLPPFADIAVSDAELEDLKDKIMYMEMKMLAEFEEEEENNDEDDSEKRHHSCCC